jgi:hypothetical protein
VSSKGYTLLGWIVYQVLSRVLKYKVRQNKVKVGAVATVALVLVAGLAAAKAAGGED